MIKPLFFLLILFFISSFSFGNMGAKGIPKDQFILLQDSLENDSTDIWLRRDKESKEIEISIGYENRQHSFSTNAISILENDQFNAGFINDPLGLAEGRVAGLSIVKAGGNPNNNYDARIRGLTTLYGKTSPTIIIDGMIDADPKNLDPNDIDSFEVLRDAAATAIYGIRGANGVILINTKKGKAGSMRVNYNGYVNVENAMRRLPILSKEEFIGLSNALNIDFNRFGHDTDWYEEILQTAPSQVHNLSVSGGNEKTDYYISMNYRNVQGVLKTTGFNKLNTRFNLNHKALNDKLTIGLAVSSTQNNIEYGNDRAFAYAPVYNPTAPVRSNEPEYDIYGGYFQQMLYDYYNPVALLDQKENNRKDILLNVQLRGSFEILDDLYINAAYSLQTIQELQNSYESKYSHGEGINRNGFAQKASNSHESRLFETSIHWSNEFDYGSLNVVGGYSHHEFVSEGFLAEGGDFITDAFAYNRLNAANDFDNGLGNVYSYKNSNKIIGFFGRLDYEWKNRYFISVVSRYDGSSRSGKNEKWCLYPGLSAGVDLAKIFLVNNIDQLKLRLGYGKSGNNIHADNLSIAQLEEGGLRVFYNGEFIKNYDLLFVDNPDLKTPSKTEINIGLDFNMFSGLIFGNIDYYQNKVEDILMDYNLQSPPNLNRHQWYNIGEINNAGLEVCLFSNTISSHSFTYQPSVIITKYIKNSYGSLSDSDRNLMFGVRHLSYGRVGGNVPMYEVEEHKEIGNMIAFIYEGIDENRQIKYKDLDNNGEINSRDRTTVGNGLPELELGFGNNLKYKKWELNLFFKGSFGHDLINLHRAMYETPYRVNSNNLAKSSMELKNKNGEYLDGYSSFSDRHIEKGNYFKLANLYLGYNFSLKPESIIENFTLYFTSNNLFVMTNYQGSDPEIRYGAITRYGDTSYEPMAPGFNGMEDWLMTRSFALGLKIGF